MKQKTHGRTGRAEAIRVFLRANPASTASDIVASIGSIPKCPIRKDLLPMVDRGILSEGRTKAGIAVYSFVREPTSVNQKIDDPEEKRRRRVESSKRWRLSEKGKAYIAAKRKTDRDATTARQAAQPSKPPRQKVLVYVGRRPGSQQPTLNQRVVEITSLADRRAMQSSSYRIETVEEWMARTGNAPEHLPEPHSDIPRQIPAHRGGY